MPRRRRPKFQPPRRRLCSIQRRLQPLRFASPAWQARRASGSAAARRPYPLMHERKAFLRNRCGCHASVFHGRDDHAPLFRAAARFETWEGSSSSHDPFFSREAAFSYPMVGMPRRRRPKLQPRQRRLCSIQWRPCRANGSAAARRPYLG